ncbi:MAG: DUF3604 domain-containing protein [Verrucomicrobia bacterium]|nr:DUF3604 domain-containing protein [Verrucomicrobiota bacterium]
MKRSLCTVTPAGCMAGQQGTFAFAYSPSTNLPKGAKLRFDLMNQNRPIDWEIPQTDVKEKDNLIWAEIPGGKQLAAKAIEKPGQLTPLYEFTLPSEIKAGDTFTIFLGTPLKGKEKGSRAQTFVQRRRPFHLYIDPRGKGDFREQEAFHIDIRGSELSNIRILAPSLVVRNKRFDVMVRFEDRFGNLSNLAPEGTLIELSYENLRENLNWKLFVPETGFLSLPNLYFNEPGIYKIQLKNLKTGETYFSAPIKCLFESPVSLYWGLLHGESPKYDATENIEGCLRYFRDERGLHFFATSPFESTEETSNDDWKTIVHHVAEFNEQQRFVTFLGFQYHGEESDEGLRQVLYSKDQKTIQRKKDAKTSSLKKLSKAVNPKETLSIPSFSMAKGLLTDFTNFDPTVERVVEIYNAWGSSECTAKEGNLFPIKTSGKEGYPETPDGSVLKALKNNCRFGFVAGGLDDRGVFSDLYGGDQVQYSPGLTAILATEQTREALFQALINRSCYATTGPRIIVGLHIAGSGMGSELDTKVKPGLMFNRHITGYVAAAAPIKEVALLRNGEVIKTFHSKNYMLDFEFDDSENLSEMALASPDDRPHFVFYYLRVLQQDGHMAWSSPIWIDIPDLASAPKKTKKK